MSLVAPWCTVLLAALVAACGARNASSPPAGVPAAAPDLGPVTPEPTATHDATPAPSGGPPAIVGLTAEQVQAVIKANDRGVQACYELELKKNATLRGVVSMAWNVDLMGFVLSATVTDSTLRDDDDHPDEAVDACLVREVRSWRFPPSNGDTQATFSFPFGKQRLPSEGDRTEVHGQLPPETIAHIVKLNAGRFRRCYLEGLQRNPKLSGRVIVKFVIRRDGSVSSPVDAGSDLPDAAVVACVVHAFVAVPFPQPEGGTISVVYPIVFSPGE